MNKLMYKLIDKLLYHKKTNKVVENTWNFATDTYSQAMTLCGLIQSRFFSKIDFKGKVVNNKYSVTFKVPNHMFDDELELIAGRVME